ncbi:hypothetical protein RQN9TF_18025 [Rhodococcus qingshengii]|uniref:hypothetical protein n=1 Tax=Rhodococcus TaxID=1827 RepID=UPI000F61FDAA|nr:MULTISPECIES: hypothetical protein [Rhodococcus]AZI62773.1 hypothetical protein EHW12_17570 [Rhodococcus sp. NJ-530]BDQ21115.1 hypothetical protein RQN9TF_18025 [Rhodococcus qingshengii]
MPSEKFYDSAVAVEGDANTPIITVAWALPGKSAHPGPQINGTTFDRSALNRMIRTLRKARDQVFGIDD